MGRASRGPPPSIAGRSGNSGATPAEVDISPHSVPQIGNADLLAAGLRYHQELIRLLESERMGALPEQEGVQLLPGKASKGTMQKLDKSRSSRRAHERPIGV